MADIIIHHFFDVIKKVPQFLLRSANQKLHSGSPSSIGGLDVGAVPKFGGTSERFTLRKLYK